ncbi:MAG TPA: ribonuclease P protein component [Clostridia bacterium]|nr:ribonuclease P protein component [Clostridia bacterium]
MKRCYSLKKNRDFQFTYRAGKAVSCKLFTLVYVKDRRKPKKKRSNTQALEFTGVRAGFSVSKKVGNSCCRNRAKRRLREAFSLYLPLIKPGHNLIFIVRQAVLFEPYPSLCAAVLRLLEKAGLIKEECVQ